MIGIDYVSGSGFRLQLRHFVAEVQHIVLPVETDFAEHGFEQILHICGIRVFQKLALPWSELGHILVSHASLLNKTQEDKRFFLCFVFLIGSNVKKCIQKYNICLHIYSRGSLTQHAQTLRLFKTLR